MLTLDFNGSDLALVEFFNKSGPRVTIAIQKAVRLAMEDLKTYIQAEKLQGQVLHSHKNGAGLAGSLNVRMGGDGTLIITGAVGTAIVYARIHEYGGTINIPAVSGKLMVFQGSAGPVYTMKHRAYTVTIPKRAYMEPSLQEKREAILARIRAAIVQELAA